MALYLTAILPPAELSEQIDDIRKELSERYNIYAALKPPVHITLYRPLNIEQSNESTLIKLLRPVGFNHRPFTQELLNFDCFNIQTLFITVVKNPLLSALQKDVAAVFNKNKIDPKEVKGNTSFHPHVTIAYRDIPPEIFPEIWDELKNRKFKRSFPVDHYSLLKHDGKKWQVFKDFALSKPKTLKLF
ncbi:2'-5' RNA ligase family protein [Paradesertivirga mongoliensis]|uniref:2'-5' RNA ligase family protein n=1 Tax=Paradesertivirga mongoliensis TaxID=2100740 RepID=A0ABW4ZS76_9SPHI|nr:2'-5' RNA ligase family protein [Pedobacter mongoliensis]